MNAVKKRLKTIFYICAGLLCACLLYLARFYFSEAKDAAVNPYNPRLALAGLDVKRGNVVSADGAVLAENMNAPGERHYPRGRETAHIVGFVRPYPSGAEQRYALKLISLDFEIFRRAGALITGETPAGHSAVLTIDAALQNLCYKKLENKKGAILALEPSTGKILACASAPGFDPNALAESWDGLNADPDSPFLNRAFNGLYPPGSLFKIVVATAALRYLEEDDMAYVCTGGEDFGGKSMHCYNNTAHGELDLQKAFAVSCNAYFARMAVRIGEQNLTRTAESLLFNASVGFEYGCAESAFYIPENDMNHLVESAIGQGLTLTTPLHMLTLVSAVANGGHAMKPYVADHFVTAAGRTVNRAAPKKAYALFSEAEAVLLTEMMVSCVEYGTGAGAAVKGVTAAGKTGTAEIGAGLSHGWFAGFAPAEDPRIAVVVLLENAGSSTAALPIAKEIFEFALR